MKFPITREALQAFDYAKEQEELREEEVQKRLAQILEQLCKEFKQSMNTNSKEKKFVWRQLRQIMQIDQQYSRYDYMPVKPVKDCVYGKESPVHPYSQINPNINTYLPQFIDKLKELFVGCDIIIDPLKTYLIIDWS